MTEPTHCCPWWLAYAFDNPIRRFFHKPEVMLAPYLKLGMTALDLGCGMGFFSIAMAKIVGTKGRVISVDIQEKMLDIMQQRATKAGVIDRIKPVLSDGNEIGLKEKSADFAVAVWMVHEVKGLDNFLRQVRDCLKEGGNFFVIEPKRHVSLDNFQKTCQEIERAGFSKSSEPKVSLSRAVVFSKIGS
jgi:ubiquinone/menaquinone biosynthesis C-methylase UbiE